ncbi:MAG: DUF188 domain-containing protein [Spirochaetaceae bacterium]|jgi:uncharacterized protein YaiI (UPF0178 family)|nr:DUF188 domain-containing protein [Spirochaetaceae bacterium]
MTIFVDADSCPRPARELVVRAVKRWPLKAVFVANRPVPLEIGPGIVMEICPPGEGSADNRIAELARRGDLVITRDVPLACRLVEKAILVIDDRGRIFTPENIRERLSLRDFMVELAESGLGMERTASYGRREIKSFADSLDRELRRLLG